MAKKRIKTHVCPNCKFQFSADIEHTNFCPNCGQENHNPRYPIFHYVYELFESITHFDTKFWHSLKTLFLKPGTMTKHYIDNIRGRYTPPVKMFVLVLALNIFVTVMHEKSFISKHNNSADVLTLSEEFDQASDSQMMFIIDPPFNLIIKNKPISYGQMRKLKRMPTDSIGLWLETNHMANNPISRLFGQSKKSLISQNITSEQQANKFGKIIYFFLFLCVPILALLNYICFYRKSLLLYDTLIFSIHSMIVLMLMVSIVMLLELAWRMLINPVYYFGQSKGMLIEFIFPILFNFLPASKKVFGYKWVSTIIRALIVWIALIFIMMFSITLIFAYWAI